MGAVVHDLLTKTLLGRTIAAVHAVQSAYLNRLQFDGAIH